MPQFDVHENIDPGSRAETPYLLNIQADVLSVLVTRLVVPLRSASAHHDRAITRLHPRVEVLGEPYIAFVSEMAAIPESSLGPVQASLSDYRTEIIAACDLLLTGF